MKTFEDLHCWKKAAELRRRLSKTVKRFPTEEKFKLVDQILRALRSVTANIAEGYGRYHYQEYVQYCRQGRGSLYELIDHIIVAYDEKYISENELQELKTDIEGSLALLNGFINYLLKAKSTNNNFSEPEIFYDKNQLATDY